MWLINATRHFLESSSKGPFYGFLTLLMTGAALAPFFLIAENSELQPSPNEQSPELTKSSPSEPTQDQIAKPEVLLEVATNSDSPHTLSIISDRTTKVCDGAELKVRVVQHGNTFAQEVRWFPPGSQSSTRVRQDEHIRLGAGCTLRLIKTAREEDYFAVFEISK